MSSSSIGRGASQFYAGLENTPPSSSRLTPHGHNPGTPLHRLPVPPRGPSLREQSAAELVEVVERQQQVTLELQRQNAALLVITTNIDKEVKALRQETASMREVNEARQQSSATCGPNVRGEQRSKKLPKPLKVSK